MLHCSWVEEVSEDGMARTMVHKVKAMRILAPRQRIVTTLLHCYGTFAIWPRSGWLGPPSGSMWICPMTPENLEVLAAEFAAIVPIALESAAAAS